jgi:hypothetical protein
VKCSYGLWAALQARAYAAAVFSYTGMPVPPAAKSEVFQSPEAQATFDAGEGGPLGTTPAMANGVWGPPIGMWRAGSMMPFLGIVCSLPMLAFVSALPCELLHGMKEDSLSIILKHDNIKLIRRIQISLCFN